ncbi:MAG: hypothetical protein L0229_21645 [Blastocatellia bacterium]|nr:hypothetical protein [Blastocatellia bacterium]
MKSISFYFMRALGVCALLAIIAAGTSTFARAPLGQGQSRPQYPQGEKAPEIPEEERQAMGKVLNAADATAKLQAAGEYLKKYPKSPRRPDVARHVAAEIAKLQDPAQMIGLLENFTTVFQEPSEAELVVPSLMDAYVKAGRLDDAFSRATSYLEKNPNDVATLTNMALIGVEQIKKQNGKFAQQSMTFGMKAIQMIEADSRPESISIADWLEYQTRWLPQLYQSLGLISYASGNKADAKAKLEKSASLKSSDPFTFLLLSGIVNDEYRELAEQHKNATPGSGKDELLKKAHTKMDEIIELYAHVLALSEGKPEYQQLHDEIMKDFQAYYKYRHNDSTDGMQEIIDKYKKP